MKVRERLFSYPVLSDFSDDFPGQKFQLMPLNPHINGDDIQIEIQLQNSSPGLDDLISQKKAAYTAHIECPSTCLRLAFESERPKFSLNISKRDVNVLMELCFMIVATQEFQYNLPEFHEAYSGQSFKIKPGDILAIGPSANIDLDIDLKWTMPSIFEIKPVPEEQQGFYEVDIGENRIIIRVDKTTYDIYCGLKGQGVTEILQSIIAMPALVHAVGMILRPEGEDNDLAEKRWYRIIKNRILTLGIENDDPVSIANKLINSVLGKAMINVYEATNEPE